jgi:hypothetical protein
MKRKVLAILFIVSSSVLHAQSLYTFILNWVSEDFKFPLVGVANIANGNHSTVEIGALNINTGGFFGLQTGAANINVGNISGPQIGAANINGGNANGAQIGAANINGGDVNGVQIGVLNYANKINGLQIGVLNIIKDGNNAVPIGLLAIVLSNGYYAFEANLSDTSPANFAFKIGVKKLYTNIMGSYNLDSNKTSIGGGLGTIIDINERLFFNLEINSLTSYDSVGNVYSSAVEPALGYNFNTHFSLIAGPVIKWQYEEREVKPLFRITEFEIDNNSKIIIGAKAALRFRI